MAGTGTGKGRKVLFGALVAGLWFGSGSAGAQVLTLEQLNWQGIASSTPDSTWGRATIDFTGQPGVLYLNVNVDGNWVVQNMGVSSLFGPGTPQTVSTFFDLFVPDGTDVPSVNASASLTAFQLMGPPAGPVPSPVGNLDYQIGGEDNVDLGSPAPPDPPTGGAGTSTVTQEAKLPSIDKFDNQVQAPNECAPGAISNSLKYLQAAGKPKLDSTVPTGIPDIRTVVGTTANGTPANWPTVKKDHFKDKIDTTLLTPAQLNELVAAVNAGQDCELDLKGHVAVIVGVRVYSDGRVELDIMDDNQTDNKKDPVRTVEIKGGKINGRLVERFVCEKAKPNLTPTLGGPALTLLIALFVTAGFAVTSLRARKPRGRGASA